jgi:parallel beta-helix repeat protein
MKNRNMALKVLSFIFLQLLILTLLPSINGQNITDFTVHEGESIQMAIDAAQENSTIFIEPGIYNECIVIQKPVKLIGSGESTVIQSQTSEKTIDIRRGVVGAMLANLFVNGSKVEYSTGVFIGGMDTVVENVTVANHDIGLHIYDSSGNVLRNNHLINNTYNLRTYGLYLPHFLHDIDSSNLVDGKKVYYWINVHDKTFPLDAGYIAAVNCSNVTIGNLELTDNFVGVLLAYTNDALIYNVTCQRNEQGIRALCSNNTVIMNSSLCSNWSGILLSTSSNNTISGNVVESNDFGIYASYSDLLSAYSVNNTILGNVITHNNKGIYLDKSSYNEIFNNEIASNAIGISLYDSGNNTFYHNSFTNNTNNVEFMTYIGPQVTNKWDNGYPDGGNYWSDYAGLDSYSGSWQNETGSDGVGDTPYLIDEDNRDDYPIMHPYGSVCNVNTGIAYLTIQSAINAPETLEGHTIFVKSGVYDEPVTINKTISLIGEKRDSTIIETESEYDAVTIIACNTTLSGFTITNKGAPALSKGIRLFNASYNIIQNNIITEKFIGIRLENGSSNNIIQNNVIKNNRYGIFINRSHRNTLFNNSIINSYWNGIELAYCERNIIEANTISGNGAYGLEIPMYTASYNNIIFHNNFLNNSWNNPSGAYASDFFNSTWNIAGEGNYWDNYRGIDENQDGIGDTPYVIYDDIYDNQWRQISDEYPLMGRFSLFQILNHSVSVISNSVIRDVNFKLGHPNGEILLDVSEENSSDGFIRICIPRSLLNSPFYVMLDQEVINSSRVKELPSSNETLLYLYISYAQGEHLIEIYGTTEVPEMPGILFVSVFLIAFFLAYIKKYAKHYVCVKYKLKT